MTCVLAWTLNTGVGFGVEDLLGRGPGTCTSTNLLIPAFSAVSFSVTRHRHGEPITKVILPSDFNFLGPGPFPFVMLLRVAVVAWA